MDESLMLYQNQLQQINDALLVASGDQMPDLLQLQKDLEEIIELTKHSISETDSAQIQEEAHSNEKHLENELDALEGVKCKVPFHYKWGGVGYHDAIILSSELSEDGSVLIRVVFMHPITKKMQPCPYFLEGTCKYSDEKCHFSHGHQVQLENLRDYSEPDYNSISEGNTVLAKYKDGLWYKGLVENVINGTEFSVKFLHCNDVQLLDLHSIYPLEEGEEESSDDDSVDNGEDDSQFIPRFIDESKTTASTGKNKGFGDWEKHTRGIGSRLMEKMGYVPGSGLGKEGEGRLEPVQAMVFPPGRSLDRCMELREKVGDGDMLSVEKKLERQKAKAEQRLKQLAQAKKDLSLFDLINSKLAKQTHEHEAKAGGTSKEQPKMAELKQMSHKNLNVRSLQISEEIKRTERDIVKIKQSLERQRERGDVASVAQIRARLAEKEKELDRLKASDQHIAREQSQRKSSSKLTIF